MSYLECARVSPEEFLTTKRDVLPPELLRDELPLVDESFLDERYEARQEVIKSFVNKGTTTLAFIFNGGVIMACDSRASMGQAVSDSTVRKVVPISERLMGSIAGGAADCQFWLKHLGRLCRLYELRHRERIPVAAASNMLSNIFWQYRAHGLSAGCVIAGFDEAAGPQIFRVDNEGTKLETRLFSVGSGSTYAYGVLDEAWKEDMTVEEAVALARRAICAATHRDAFSGGYVRVYLGTVDGWQTMDPGTDVSELLWKYKEDRM